MFNYIEYFQGSVDLPLRIGVPLLSVLEKPHYEIHEDNKYCVFEWDNQNGVPKYLKITKNVFVHVMDIVRSVFDGDITDMDALKEIHDTYGFPYGYGIVHPASTGLYGVKRIDIEHEFTILSYGFLMFLCWCRNKWGDDTAKLAKYKRYSPFKDVDPHLSDDEYANQILKAKYGNEISIIINESQNGFELGAICHTLPQALNVFMLQVIAGSNAIINGYSIEHCGNCKTPFVKTHGNATLCENCRTNKAKLRALRTKKKMEKEAARNAEKTSE